MAVAIGVGGVSQAFATTAKHPNCQAVLKKFSDRMAALAAVAPATAAIAAVGGGRR